MIADTPHDLGLTEVVLRPVRGHHAFEACVEQLGTLIRLGVYPLGTTLPSERVLADRLHVSRATLREAMAALREAGAARFPGTRDTSGEAATMSSASGPVGESRFTRR